MVGFVSACRFPVIEWRGRIEVFQKKAIRASRKGAGSHAYDYSDYVPPRQVAQQDRQYGDPTQIERIDWSNRPPMDHPQASYGGDSDALGRHAPEVHDPFAPDVDQMAPGARRYASDSASHIDSPSASEYNDSPYFDDDPARAYGDAPPHDFEQAAGDRSSSYANFLASANRQIARGNNARDPFFSSGASGRGSFTDDGGVLQAPTRPFTMHSRVSSHSSISSIVDEHGSSSPLNKAMETFTDAQGTVASDFVQKLKNLNSDNSKGDLCIEKCE